MTQIARPEPDTTPLPGNTPLPERLLQLFRQYWKRHLRGINRSEAEHRVIVGGRLSPSFAFLVVTSCAIATLGLLLNSVAVIIGAMLIAPLMGPIVLLGFAIAMTDVTHGISATKALVISVGMALLTSFIIVKLAPFIPPTPEILARTQPNAFDLLVAVIAGLVGGYAMVRSEAGTVAGVAISTALMPPLASAGYGLAIHSGPIFQGAFFLFLTNMVAIALSAGGIALWYNFGNLRTPRDLLWKTLLGALVLMVLSIPLVRSLNLAVTQTLTAKGVEEVLRTQGTAKSWKIGQLQVEDKEGESLHVTAVVFVREEDKKAQDELQQALVTHFRRPVKVSLEQIEFGSRRTILPTVAPPNVVTHEPTDAEAMQQHLRRFVPYPVAALEISAVSKSTTIQIGATYVGNLVSLQALEQTLAAGFPNWTVRVIPPRMPLPAIYFDTRTASLSEDSKKLVAISAWALQRWGISRVRINGGVSSDEGRVARKLSQSRAQAVADALKPAGIQATLSTLPFSAQQASAERDPGRAVFRRAIIDAEAVAAH
jgi:uncharacterized hydrophobic protein (TIGR00271 family)